MRRSKALARTCFAIAVIGLLVLFAPEARAVGCVDYGSGPRVVGEFPTTATTFDVELVGDQLFAVETSALTILDASDPENLSFLGRVELPSACRDVAISGDHAIVTNTLAGVFVIDIGVPSDPTVVGHVDPVGSSWGVAIHQGYAVVANTIGRCDVLDISDPTNPYVYGSVTTVQDADCSKVVIQGNLAYMPAGHWGLHVVDLTNPAHPSVAGIFDDGSDSFRDVIVAGDVAYASVYPGGTGDVVAIDVGNPAAMSRITTFGWADHPSGLALDGATLYVADTYSGLGLFDVSNPLAPALLGAVGSGDRAFAMRTAGSLVLLADGDAGVTTIDVSSPVSTKLQAHGVGSYGIVAMDVAVDYAWVVDPYEGIRVVDLADPLAPVEVASFVAPMGLPADVVADGDRACVAIEYWIPARSDPARDTSEDRRAATAIDAGVSVIDLADPANPVVLSTWDSPDEPLGLDKVNDRLYVADRYAGLHVVDVTPEGDLAWLGTVATPGIATDVSVANTTAYVAGDASGVHLVDIADPASMSIIGTYDTAGAAQSIAVDGVIAYVADGANGIVILDVTDPGAIVELARIDLPNGAPATQAVVVDARLYVTHRVFVSVYDVSVPAQPTWVGSAVTSDAVVFVDAVGSELYLAQRDGIAVTGLQCTDARFVDIEAGLPGVYQSAGSWGDYDNDGDLDILLTGTAGSQYIARIYRNDGGSFVDIEAGLQGAWVSTAEWGDYDNDGDLDILLTGDTDAGYVSRVYRNDAGIFVDIAAGLPGIWSGFAGWGDYDNDGDLDIVLTGDTGSEWISRVYRNADGSFMDAGAGLVGASYSHAAWGDYDNDGDLDILLTGRSLQGTITRLYRNDSGVFVDVEAGLEGVYSYSFPSEWGDYDNDGDLDILLTGSIGLNEYISRIYRNDAGTFVDIGAGLTDAGNSTATWGDYDNDGDLDIVLTGYADTGGISKVYRNEAGTFLPIGAGLAGVYISSTEWGDYDNDGDLDIVLTGNSDIGRIARVYRNDAAAIPNNAPSAPTNLNAQLSGSTLTLSWDAATDVETPAPGLSYNLRVGTTPGGDDIMAPMADASNGYRWIPALGNVQQNTSWTLDVPADGTYYWSVQAIDACFAGSAFAAEQQVQVSLFVDVATGLPDLQQSSSAWGDYDNDGDLDILLVGNDGSYTSFISRVYRNDAGVFVDIDAGLEGAWLGSVAWGDYDNDGDLDILLTGSGNSGLTARVYRNDGGVFVDINAGLEGVWISSVAWGDYDKDGDLDILLTGQSGMMTPEGMTVVITRVYRNDGGVFVDIDADLPDLQESSVAWGDYDNDGDLDILMAGWNNLYGPAVAYVYRNDGGHFVDAGAGLPGVHQSAVAWGDYDNDGDLDIVITGRSQAGPMSRLYRNDAGGFVDVQAGLLDVGEGSVAWGDYDNDGDLDLLLTGDAGSEYVARLYRNDAGSFQSVATPLVGVAASSISWGDCDNDGDLDVLITGGAKPDGSEVQAASRLYRNDAAAAPNSPPSAPVDLSAQQDGSTLTLNWSAATDAETPAAGLSYNLRLGTTPGGDEISAGMADAVSGFRRIPSLGNAQQQLSRSLDVSAIAPGTMLYWSVQTVDTAFAGSAFAGEENLVRETVVAAPVLPTRFALHPSIPNPFNPSTMIRFELPEAGQVELAIYDVAGRRVRTLVQEARAAGRHEVLWRGEDQDGRQVASGVYLYRLEAGSYVETHTMTLVK